MDVRNVRKKEAVTMKEVVIVSSWRRADYINQCLRALSKARGIENKLVWIFQNDRQDSGVDLAPVHFVLDQAKNLFSNLKITRQNVVDGEYTGWVWAQYDAWKQAYESGAPRVYFFSDDDICTPDYFEWHDAVQADGDWFATCAWRHQHGQTKPFDLEAYYQISYPEEIGHGFGVNRDNLGLMLQTPPIVSCNSVRAADENWKIVMPYVQRVFHIGTRSSHIPAEENFGAAMDLPVPSPIPDYGRQKVKLMS